MSWMRRLLMEQRPFSVLGPCLWSESCRECRLWGSPAPNLGLRIVGKSVTYCRIKISLSLIKSPLTHLANLASLTRGRSLPRSHHWALGKPSGSLRVLRNVCLCWWAKEVYWICSFEMDREAVWEYSAPLQFIPSGHYYDNRRSIFKRLKCRWQFIQEYPFQRFKSWWESLAMHSLVYSEAGASWAARKSETSTRCA